MLPKSCRMNLYIRDEVDKWTVHQVWTVKALKQKYAENLEVKNTS